MPKVAIKRYRLPIDEETAEIIREQQARAGHNTPAHPPRRWPCSRPA